MALITVVFGRFVPLLLAALLVACGGGGGVALEASQAMLGLTAWRAE